MTTNIEFHKNLKKIMFMYDKNMSDIARLVGVKPQSVRDWFEKNSLPRTNNIEALASEFSISSKTLVYGKVISRESYKEKKRKDLEYSDKKHSTTNTTLEAIMQEVLDMPVEARADLLKNIQIMKKNSYNKTVKKKKPAKKK